MSLSKQADLDSLKAMIDALAGALGDKDSMYGEDELAPYEGDDDEIPAEGEDEAPTVSVLSLSKDEDEDLPPTSEDLGLGRNLPTDELDTEEDPDTLKALIRARLAR